jgi:hypothetical protein
MIQALIPLTDTSAFLLQICRMIKYRATPVESSSDQSATPQVPESTDIELL